MKKRWLRFLALFLTIAMLTTLAPVSAFAADAPDGGTLSADGADAGLPEDGADAGLPEDGADAGLPEDGGDAGLPEDGGDAGLPEDGGDTTLPEDGLSAEDEIMPQADTPLTIEGYTQVTAMPAEGLSGNYLIVAPYNGSYYMLYPGATGGGQNVKNAAKLVVGANGAATGYKVNVPDYNDTEAKTDFSAAENTIAKSGTNYSVTAVGPGGATYYLFNGSNPIYHTASPSTLTIEASTTAAGCFYLRNTASSYLLFYEPWVNYAQGGTLGDDCFPNLMLFKRDSGTDEPADDPLAIPGYTQVTQLNQIKADRKYLVAAQGKNGLYALYPRLSNGVSPGALPNANTYGLRCAKLTVSGSNITAAAADSHGASGLTENVSLSDLLLTITSSGGDYTFESSADSSVKLNLAGSMFSDTATALSVDINDDNTLNVRNGESRYLTFSEYGTAYNFQNGSKSFGTDFWGPNMSQGAPLYLFIEGGLPTDPGRNLVQMLSGDKIDTTAVAENANPDGQNSWAFTGGRAAQGSFADVAGARTWAGHFEEYVRYTHAKQLQPTGEANTPYFQRHVINAAYEGQTLQNIVESFDTRIGALKPRAVVYLVDEGGSSEANFAANLNTLITRSLALQNNTGKIVIATLTEADKTAVDTVVAGLAAEKQADVLPVLISLTDAQKTGGYPNASGHFAMAQQLTDAIVGSNVSADSRWPYGVAALPASVLASDFPNKTTVDAHHTYRTPSTLNDAQRAVQALAEGSTPATWLFMGDSITHGSAWTGGYDTLAQLFEKFVKDDLGRKQDIVINAGSSGANSNSTISDLNRRLVKYDPDVVVLMLGTNDTAISVSEATYKANLRAILDKIMAKGAVPVLRTPPPTNRGYDIETYAQYIRDVAAESKYAGNVILVDQYARWTSVNWVDVFTRDSLHPDEAGHLWFVHQLIKELALWDDNSEICQLEYVEMKEPAGITIPGYTQLTNLSGLDENKGYMIVSRDQAGNLYALYPSEDGKTLGAGVLPAAGTADVGARAASLTVDGENVTAKWLKDDSPQSLEKLLFTIERGANGGYIFTAFNGRHLNMADYMFTDGSVELTVTNRGTAALNSFVIENTNSGRVLDFNKNGDSGSFQGGTYGTDFWCPRAINVPVYLFASDTAAVPTAKDGIVTLIREDIDGRLTEDDYTHASWANLQKALTAAREALASGETNGDAQVYITARDNLQSAYDNLQRKPVIPTVPAGATKIEDWRDLVPDPGDVSGTGNPFPSMTGGSKNFRIPAMITLKHQTGANADKNGRLLAAIDARWNHSWDARDLDTIVSYSDDNGDHWKYLFANYFGDNVNQMEADSTAFIDPQLTEGLDGTIYLMVDLYPGYVAITGGVNQPDTATGYEEIDGQKRLVLYTSVSAQNSSNYSYYIGDFEGGYAPVYEPAEDGDTFSGYYVDEFYYLYHTDGDYAVKAPESDKIYCQRLGSDTQWVQQNVFFRRATLHVRNASYLWIVKSTDGGETWSAPEMINDQVRTGADKFYGVGPGAGLCVDTAGSTDPNAIPNGTIILPVYTHSTEFAGFIYTVTDNGETKWKRGNNATTSENHGWSSESCLVQISDTTVRHFYRDAYTTLYYTDHTWNGSGWTTGTPVDTGAESDWGTQLSAIKHSTLVDGKQLIIVSTPGSGSSHRTTGKLYAFLVNNDTDKTMTLCNTYSVNGDAYYCYSSLSETRNGNIALLYESGWTGDGVNNLGSVAFEVIPIERIIPNLTVTGYEGAYDGQVHSFTVSASAGCALEYSTDGGTSWSATKPTFTDAGTYTVTVRGTWGSFVRTQTATVTIRQVTPTLSITSAQGAVVAPGETITLTVHGVPAGTDASRILLACDHTEHDHDPNVVLTRQTDGTWTGAHETAQEDATYTFTATYTGNTNYAPATATYQVQVTGGIDVTVRAYTGVYDGQPHSIIVNAEDGVTMTYCETVDGTYTSDLPAYTNAGTYTTYYLAGKGDKTVSGFAHVTISKATPVLTITCDKGTELSTEDLPLSLTISGVPAGDQGKFTLSTFNDALRNVNPNGDGTWTAAPQLPPVTRTYTFTAVFDPAQTQDGTAIDNPNYERATAELTVTVTRPTSSVEVDFSFSSEVTVDSATPVIGTYTVPYDGESHTVAGALVCGEGVTVQYHVPITDIEGNEIGDTWVTEPPAYTQPGEYTVTCMGSKGSSAKVLTVMLKIEEGNIETHLTITPSPAGLTGGGDVTLTVSGMPNVGDLTVTCDNKSVTVNETAARGKYTVTLPDENGTYTFTASYSGAGSYQPAEATCSVTVTGGTVTTKHAINLDAPTGSAVAVTVEGTAATEAENGKTVTVAVTGADDKAVNVAVTDADGADVAAAKDAGSNTWTFTMPDKAVTVKVTITSGTVTVDKTALNTAIEAANTAKEGVGVKPEGTTAADVAKGVKFVTEAEMKALTGAIADAQAAAGKADATQAEVDAAVTTLNAAVEAFKGAIKTGTYTPSVPSVVTPSNPPTTTKVEKNEDGSTTTTVTDKKTGTVTATTEKPDGTKQIVETKKDGTVTETIEKVDGSKQIVETKKDGTVTETIEKTDGTKQIVETRKDGTVTETSEKADGSKQVVETKPDGTVTETKVDSEGAKAEKVTDSEKNTEIKVTDATGEVLAEVKLPAEVPAPDKRFEDVPEGHWADEAIHEMAGLGVVNGVSDSKFDMNSGIKRGDLALLLACLSNAKTEDVTTAFTDVPAGKYYAGGVAWAAKNGIVTGRSEDTFDPEATITRGELALMLYRYAKLLKMDTAADAGALDAFKDGSASPDWAVDGLAWCVGSGIMRGRGDNTLDPRSDITRAEVAVMLQRFTALMK